MSTPANQPQKPAAKVSPPKDFHYVNGLTIHTARRLCDFQFGKDHIFKIVKNDKERTFDIFLLEGVNEDGVVHFRRFWGKNLRVFIINPTQVADSKNE